MCFQLLTQIVHIENVLNVLHLAHDDMPLDFEEEKPKIYAMTTSAITTDYNLPEA